jgi:hypothetical protein
VCVGFEGVQVEERGVLQKVIFSLSNEVAKVYKY